MSKPEEVPFLGKELKEEKSKHTKQVEWMVQKSKIIQSLEDESKSLKSKAAKAETTLRILLINEAQHKDSMTDTLN
jgi:hypothetical protein